VFWLQVSTLYFVIWLTQRGCLTSKLRVVFPDSEGDFFARSFFLSFFLSSFLSFFPSFFLSVIPFSPLYFVVLFIYFMAHCMKCETRSKSQRLYLKYITNKCTIYVTVLICFLNQLYKIHLKYADNSCGMWQYVQTSISFQ